MRTHYNARHTFDDLGVGMHVSIYNGQEGDHTPFGRIVGFGTVKDSPTVIVALDSPGYLEGREQYVSITIAHPSNLIRTRPVTR